MVEAGIFRIVTSLEPYAQHGDDGKADDKHDYHDDPLVMGRPPGQSTVNNRALLQPHTKRLLTRTEERGRRFGPWPWRCLSKSRNPSARTSIESTRRWSWFSLQRNRSRCTMSSATSDRTHWSTSRRKYRRRYYGGSTGGSTGKNTRRRSNGRLPGQPEGHSHSAPASGCCMTDHIGGRNRRRRRAGGTCRRRQRGPRRPGRREGRGRRGSAREPATPT